MGNIKRKGNLFEETIESKAVFSIEDLDREIMDCQQTINDAEERLAVLQSKKSLVLTLKQAKNS